MANTKTSKVVSTIFACFFTANSAFADQFRNGSEVPLPEGSDLTAVNFPNGRINVVCGTDAVLRAIHQNTNSWASFGIRRYFLEKSRTRGFSSPIDGVSNETGGMTHMSFELSYPYDQETAKNTIRTLNKVFGEGTARPLNPIVDYNNGDESPDAYGFVVSSYFAFNGDLDQAMKLGLEGTCTSELPEYETFAPPSLEND